MRREAEEGTGNRVGRTVVQSVVDAHGGTVSWSSPRPGEFLARVVLPISADAAVLPESRDASTHSTDDATRSQARSGVNPR